jgi:lipid A ethanolaminephosphotransferase
MSLKLFRVTEFAESVFFSPQAQRRSIHPAILIIGYALWLAIIGNLALWQTLKDTGAATLLTAGALITSATVMALALLCWRPTLKLVITLLLFAAALGTCLVWFQHQPVDSATLTRLVMGPQRGWGRFVSWESALTVLLVALLPAIVLARVPVKRISPVRHVLMNALFFIASYALYMWASSPNDSPTSAILQKHIQNPTAVNPVNTLVALGQLVSKKVPLPAQQ